MFRGISDHHLDAKGRLTMPSRFREQILKTCGGSLIITVGFNYCGLWIYPLPDWEQAEEKILRLPNLVGVGRDLSLTLLANATECEMDGQNRVLIPPKLRSEVGLEKDTVLFGLGKKLELWDSTAWQENRKTKLDDDVGSVVETLSL